MTIDAVTTGSSDPHVVSRCAMLVDVIASTTSQEKPQGQLQGRVVTEAASGESPLPSELDQLVSSFVPPEDLQTINGLAGGRLARIPAMINLKAHLVAMYQTVLRVHNQNITTEDLQAIRRDFPQLRELDITGSTLNGELGILGCEVQVLYGEPAVLQVKGLAPLNERIAGVEAEMNSLKSTRSSLAMMQNMTQVPQEGAAQSQEMAPLNDARIDRQITGINARLEQLSMRLTQLRMESIFESMNATAFAIASSMK